MLHRKGKGKEAKAGVSRPRAAGQSTGACRQRLRDPRDGDRRTRRGGAGCWRPAPPRAARSGRTRATMWRASLPTCASRTSRPTWRKKVRGSAIDGRTTRPAGYHVRQRKRTLVEQVFGWMQTVRRPAQAPASRHRPGGLAAHLRRHRLSLGSVAESGGEVSLIAGRGCRWPPRRDSVSPCAPLSGGA